MYCAYHDMDEYAYVTERDPRGYYTMQIVDYILANEDRHGANFGFYMDNRTGKLLELYPLMDHDHSFRRRTPSHPRLRRKKRRWRQRRSGQPEPDHGRSITRRCFG